jgi:hypothetical protein
MQAVASTPLILAGKQAVIGHLTSGLAPALRDRKSRHWAHAISRLAQRFQCFGQSKPQRTNYACSHNGNASPDFFFIRIARLSHGWREKLPRDFLLLSYSKHFTCEPKRKRSPEVGGLSVEFIQ